METFVIDSNEYGQATLVTVINNAVRFHYVDAYNKDDALARAWKKCQTLAQQYAKRNNVRVFYTAASADALDAAIAAGAKVSRESRAAYVAR